jgi:DNA-binding transcriptional ArsR family regulator
MTVEDPGASKPSPDPAVQPEFRRITDARTMRALAHPVRIALLEELVLGGALTATELGERIGESPTTCSFHLRQLAKYGFVEEAGGGKGRARPWRLTAIGISYSNTHDDPATEIAAGALSRVVRERQLGRYWTWAETRGTYPREWREAANDSEYLFYLTADELKQLNREVLDMLLPRFRERLNDPSLRPPGSVPVEMLVFTFPIKPPDTEGEGAAPADGAAGAGTPAPADGEPPSGGAG